MRSILEALEEKYCQQEAESEIPIAIYVPRKSPRKSLPALLVLDDCRIDCAGDLDTLRLQCSQVQELDLAQNKLCDWSQVLSILVSMPQLRFVNLAFNNLSRPMSTGEAHFPHLSTLILNGTRVDWASMAIMLAACPALQELGLALNHFCNVGSELLHSPHPRLRRLFFNANPVSQWSEVQRLDVAFPQLEVLVMADCPITSLYAPPSGPPSPPPSPSSSSSSSAATSTSTTFANLLSLNLNNSLLSRWEDLNNLRFFPSLKELRIQACPLLEDYTEHERRQLVIARIPNLEKLNGGARISSEEREDAERAFIRRYMDQHPSDRPSRYDELVNVHGRLDPLVEVDLRPERYVEVGVIMEEGNRTKDTRKLMVDVHWSVGELRVRLERCLQLQGVSRMRLFYLDRELSAVVGPEEMRFPAKKLYSFNICNGDEILLVLPED